MLHVHYWIKRRSDMDPKAFRRYWRDVHGPIVRQIPQLKGYVQSHGVELDGINTSPYDGAAEAWVEDEAAFQAMLKEPSYLEGALADEPNFIDMNNVEFQVTEDRVILGGPRRDGWVKGLYRIKRRPEFSVAEFRRYWLDVHAGFGLKLPGLRRYVQCVTTDSAYRDGDPAWDGVAHIWFDDTEALRRMVESAMGAESYADILRFVSAFDVLVAEEHPVLMPAS